MSENIIKKESGIIYKRSFLNAPKGDLILTAKELYFLSRGKEKFRIPLSSITNARAKKGFGTGIDLLLIDYENDGKGKQIKLQHISLVGLSIGQLSRLQGLYFSSWEQVIESTRIHKTSNNFSNLDELEKLAELRKKGIINEEEFNTKKKQILNI